MRHRARAERPRSQLLASPESRMGKSTPRRRVAGAIADVRGAVGGDEDRRQVAIEAPAQLRDGDDAVGAVEMIIDEKPVRLETASLHRGERGGEVGRREHAAAPTTQQGLHAVQNGPLVVDAEHDGAGETPAGGAGNRVQHRLGGGLRRARYFDGNARAAAGAGFEYHLAVEHARDALDDREAQAHAARDARALVEAVELLEHRAALAERNADTGVVDLDAQALAASPASHQHAPRRRVFDRVGDEILQQSPQQAAVRTHRQRARHEDDVETLFPRQRRKFHLEALQQFVDAEIGHLRLHRAGVEPRNVEQGGEYLLDRLERGVDVAHEIAIFAAALAFDQAGHVKTRGIERLQDVVARGGDETRLRGVGFVRLGLGALKFGIEPRQLPGALAHAALQRGIGALERFGRLYARRDVGEGRNQAAIGHAVGANLDDQAAFGEAFEEGLAFAGVFGNALGHLPVEARRVARALRDMAEDLVERDADAGEPVRQIEDLAELAVPAEQRQLLVEHRDPLPDVVERGLQNLAIVVDRRIGVVEKLERILGRDRALAQK